MLLLILRHFISNQWLDRFENGLGLSRRCRRITGVRGALLLDAREIHSTPKVSPIVGFIRGGPLTCEDQSSWMAEIDIRQSAFNWRLA